MSKREVYEKKFEAQLDEWNAEIDKLQAQAKRKEADAQAQLSKRVDELKRKRDDARKKLAELKSAGDDAWDDIKEGAEAAWQSMSAAVRSATSRLQQ